MIKEWNGAYYEQQMMAATVRAFYKLGMKMIPDTKRKMANQQGPSVPGDYPAVDKSRLMNSLTIEVNETKPSLRFGSPITTPPYPYFLEMGTQKMAPRPWLRPCLEMIRPEVIPAIRAELRGILR